MAYEYTMNMGGICKSLDEIGREMSGILHQKGWLVANLNDRIDVSKGVGDPIFASISCNSGCLVLAIHIGTSRDKCQDVDVFANAMRLMGFSGQLIEE